MSDDSYNPAELAADDPDGAMMYIACSRCRKILDIKPGNLGSITHSLCEDCLKITIEEIEEYKKKQRQE